MEERILIVEDEEKLARFVELELLHEGYRPQKVADGRDALEMALREGYDLVLLDIMLPGLSGMEVLRRLRRESEVPVILLTARDSVTDKVMGLDTGANDYVTKPFEIEELLARIRACLRKKPRVEKNHVLQAGLLKVDQDRYQAEYNGTAIELTAREFTLLKTLMENEGIVLSRETLLDKVWGYQYMGETNVVDVYIRYLRSKIDDVFGVKLIHTVRGVGYTLREPV